MEPWVGTLTIDAVLEGGRAAHTTADASGARELILEPVPAAGTATPQRPRQPPSVVTTKPPGDINLAR